MREKKKTLCLCVAAFLGMYGISYLLNIRGGMKFSDSVLTIPLAVGLYLLFRYSLQNFLQNPVCARDKKALRRHAGYVAFVSILFGVLMVMGCQLQWTGYTQSGYLGKLKILWRGCCVALAVAPFVNLLLQWVAKLQTCAPAKSKKEWKSPHVFFASWAGIWLCYIPVWLAYYPVIMSYDFHRQSLLVFWGPKGFDGHHPLAHSLLLWVFHELGEALGSYIVGYAWFSLFQQMIVSAVLAYSCAMIYRLTKRKWVTVLSGLFFGLFPVISVFVMCTTKDVLFGAFFVLFLLLFVERMFFSEGRKKAILSAVWVAEGVLMMLFRNNAWHAMLPFGILFFVLSRKKERLQALLLGVSLIVCGKGALFGIQAGLGVSPGKEIEKYSVIIQTMARAGMYRHDTLPDVLQDALDFYVPRECQEGYFPPIADGAKAALNETENWNDIRPILPIWIKVGLACPNEYLDAFLELTRGYWFFDDLSHAEMLGVGVEDRMGLLYTYNSVAELSMPTLVHVSKFPWLEEKYEKLLSANCYYDYPVISNLFKPALWCWLMVLCMVCYVYMRERKKMLVNLYPLCYFGTMLLGPTANIRYAFPIVLLAPLLLALLCRQSDDAETVKSDREKVG